jgi:hypothetical protein
MTAPLAKRRASADRIDPLTSSRVVGRRRGNNRTPEQGRIGISGCSGIHAALGLGLIAAYREGHDRYDGVVIPFADQPK